VECATVSGWLRAEVQASHELLVAGIGDAEARESLLAQWRPHLAACKTD